jgi:hypothetical protein
MYLLGILLWVATVVWLSLRLTKKYKSPIVRAGVVVAAVPLSIVLVLADEIIGKYQFDKLCDEAKEVKIHATHPVGEDLYTSEGKWREGDSWKERKQLGTIYETFLRWEFGRPEEMPRAIPIRKHLTKVYDKTDGRLLAEFVGYGTSGGWLARVLGGPILVAPACSPKLIERGQLKAQILPFSKSTKETK